MKLIRSGRPMVNKLRLPVTGMEISTLFIMPADGGTARRLTYHSASEIPSAFTPDGKVCTFLRLHSGPAQAVPCFLPEP